MKKIGNCLIVFLQIIAFAGYGQVSDSNSIQLNEISVKGYKTMNGVGHINGYLGQVVFSGKKNEVLIIDSLDANKAINNTRQIIGRIPGLNIIESESGGFTANGIGFRGVNPYQSVEMNTRQNGYNISADIFGYNEAYYLPPMEAISNIEFMRGAAGLQFGPQIGGLVNYVIKEAPLKPIELCVTQTIGNYGLYNLYTSLGGTIGKWQYFGFVQNRVINGWRENSDQQQLSGYGKLTYNFKPELKVSLEYTMLRNTIHMPGGLNDSEFTKNPQLSLRARNWLQSPWNIISATTNYKISKNTSISFVSSYQFSERSLIWQNEDSWYPNFIPDSIGVARELEREYFNSLTNELRVLTNYDFKGTANTLAFGIRQAYSSLMRYEGGVGSDGNNLDLNEYKPFTTSMNFVSNNISLFAENIIHIGDRLCITPGFRYEFLATSASGFTENKDTATSAALPQLEVKNQQNIRTFLLGGIGMQYELSNKINVYSNVSQSYKPITYSNLTPFGTAARIGPNLKDTKAVNADIGIRGTIKAFLNFDLSAFYLNVYDGIGTVNTKGTDNNFYTLVTNTGNSLHTGIETYMELSINDLFFPKQHIGRLSLYNSLAYISAVYTAGDYINNQVEYAPHIIERIGINYMLKGFEINAQYNYQSKSYGDASNAITSASAEIGMIPSYTVADVSASYKWLNYKVSFGVNNLTDNHYFTLRTSEYPGPGIIPSMGRMMYIGLNVRL